MFRNAAAFGADAVLLGERTGDPLYRRSLRVSMGHVLRVPFARLDALRILRHAGFCVVALTPARDAESLASLAKDAARPAKVALLLGAEGPGLSDAWLAEADRRVRIPMAGGVDSLNVAVAAALALYELRRQDRSQDSP